MHVCVRSHARELRATAVRLVHAHSGALHSRVAPPLVESSLSVKLVADNRIRHVARHIASPLALHQPQLDLGEIRLKVQLGHTYLVVHRHGHHLQLGPEGPHAWNLSIITDLALSRLDG